MYNTRWSTKEQVLEDLGRASGRRPSDVDDGCLVFGERPPPPKICNNEDEEMELYFGLVKSSAAAPAQQTAAVPDLHGITEMIRMVQNYGEEGDAAHTAKRDLTETSSNEVIVINKLNKPYASNKLTTSNLSSKLNPNVEEFVPRTLGANAADARAHSIKCQTSEQAPAPRPVSVPSAADPDIQQPDDTDVLAAVLRNEIQSAPEEGDADGFHFRRKKYAAIAHLFKLHSTSASASAPAQPVKLFTPDFYQNYRATESETKAETAHNKMTGSKDTKVSQCDKYINSDKEKSTLTPEMEGVNLGDAGATPVPLSELHTADTAAAEALDAQEVSASIRKVARWLNAETPAPAQRAPAPRATPYLGPVTYKRKERGVGAGAVDTNLPRASARADVTYVPTRYAQELGRQYAAREKALERTNLSVWDKLEQDLKRKDSELRKRNDTCGAPNSERL